MICTRINNDIWDFLISQISQCGLDANLNLICHSHFLLFLPVACVSVVIIGNLRNFFLCNLIFWNVQEIITHTAQNAPDLIFVADNYNLLQSVYFRNTLTVSVDTNKWAQKTCCLSSGQSYDFNIVKRFILAFRKRKKKYPVMDDKCTNTSESSWWHRISCFHMIQACAVKYLYGNLYR